MAVEEADHYVAKFLVSEDEWFSRPLSERVLDRLIEILIEVRAIEHELAAESFNGPANLNAKLERIYQIGSAVRGQLERGESPGLWIQSHLDEVTAVTNSVMLGFYGTTQTADPDTTVTRSVRQCMQTLAARFQKGRSLFRRLGRLLRG